MSGTLSVLKYLSDATDMSSDESASLQCICLLNNKHLWLHCGEVIYHDETGLNGKSVSTQ